MNGIVYSCPFVPAEWIAAHGLKPSRITPPADAPRMPCVGTIPGLCPYARAFANAVLARTDVAAVVVTTVCDQMRRTADLLMTLTARTGRDAGGNGSHADGHNGKRTSHPNHATHQHAREAGGQDARPPSAGAGFPLLAGARIPSRTHSSPESSPAALSESEPAGQDARTPDNGTRCPPVFVMNVPATWQTPAVRDLYRAEIQRLGRFLADIGGQPATADKLASVMRMHDAARAALRAARPQLGPRRFAERLAAFHRDGGRLPAPNEHAPCSNGIALGLVGGPLRDGDFDLFDRIERAGGTVVLDATETGEPTLPATFDDQGIRSDPLGELLRAYFDAIPDVSRRPNTELFRWLKDHAIRRGVRGIICRRYVWCDAWHSEVHRLREHLEMPVLDLDIDDDGAGANERSTGRIQAFVEMLTARISR